MQREKKKKKRKNGEKDGERLKKICKFSAPSWMGGQRGGGGGSPLPSPQPVVFPVSFCG